MNRMLMNESNLNDMHVRVPKGCSTCTYMDRILKNVTNHLNQ